VALFAVLFLTSPAKGAAPPTQSPIGPLPATFVGVLPCAGCRGRHYQLDLLPNSRFVQSTTDMRGGDNHVIEIAPGMWWISADGRKLTLDAGGDAAGDDMRWYWQVKDARTLRMLDDQGDSIASELNYELTRTDSLPPVNPGPHPPEFLPTLENTRWVPLRIGRHAVKVAAQQDEPWIALEPKTRHVTGSGGCNQFTGSYDVGVETLRIRSLDVTRLTCPDVKSETAFLQALNGTWGYRVAGRRLQLLDEHDSVLAELEERNR
jgi:heat shock protein HslJ